MDRDLFETPEEELAESGVRATIFAGRVVHGDG
jgi:predicted amidohydrolase YtcJ